MFVGKVLRAHLMVVLAVSLAGLAPGLTPGARAEASLPTSIGADARDALARMGKTLSAKQFSYRARTVRSYVGPNGELLHIEHTTKTIYRRPDYLSPPATTARSRSSTTEKTWSYTRSRPSNTSAFR